MTSPTDTPTTGAAPIATARILFATDPICSHCWAMEPAWRRFLYHYGEHVEVTHLYGGLLPQWEGFADMGAGIRVPADIPPHWDEVVERYGQPIDPSVWLTDPLDSSYPPSVAMHAVRAIAPEREEDYLRRIRQALFLEARNIARPEVLVACATDIGLDRASFEAALHAPASQAAFEGDLAQMRARGLRGFPTLVVTGPAVETPWIMRGSQPYFRLERALEAVLGALPPAREVSVEDVLREYRSGTTREFAEVLGLDAEATETELRRAGARSRPLANSQLWSAV
ncbi:MAG TPA: DsbA family protein [Gemmatimonadaceae bacterium]|nr:DsbA family protein [Gemmatimonadaceae bacterium]